MEHRKQVRIFFSRYERIKLRVGCGTVYKEAWINIDNNSDKNITQLDLQFDMRFPLSFPKNSVDFIFNEHLTVEEGQQKLTRICMFSSREA